MHWVGSQSLELRTQLRRSMMSTRTRLRCLRCTRHGRQRMYLLNDCRGSRQCPLNTLLPAQACQSKRKACRACLLVVRQLTSRNQCVTTTVPVLELRQPCHHLLLNGVLLLLLARNTPVDHLLAIPIVGSSLPIVGSPHRLRLSTMHRTSLI